MRILRLAGTALLALLATAAGAQPAQLPADTLIVRGNAVTQSEIQRILDADNVDTSRLTSRQVADAIRATPRGRAPQEFWTAYQAHVRAWQQLAAAEERAARLAPSKPRLQADAMASVAEAQGEIARSFDEVERIARLYGATMPRPPHSVDPIG